jgi:uncharacterized membrane protein HdeD (DUF308 family)
MTEAQQQQDAPDIKGILNNPFIGFAPFIIVSLVSAPGRFLLAVGLAFLASVVLTIASAVVNRLPPGALDYAGLVLFGVMLAIGLIEDSAQDWLEHNAVLLSDAVVLIVAVGGMVIGRPFTLRYAKLDPDFRRRWEDPPPGFRTAALRTSNIITAVWAGSFLIQLVCQLIVEFGPTEEHNNWLLVWGLPIASIIAAIKLTQYFADQARARGEAARQAASQ